MAPFPHRFKGEILVQFPLAVGGAEDLVLVTGGGDAAGGDGVVCLVIGLAVEEVDVCVAAVGEVEGGGEAEYAGADDEDGRGL